MRKFSHSSYDTGNCKPHLTEEETGRERLSNLLKLAYLAGGVTILSRPLDFYQFLNRALEKKQDLREDTSGSQMGLKVQSLT